MNDGPAFPSGTFAYKSLPGGAEVVRAGEVGMSLRQYAAIKLRIPKSGDAWLDDMIRESLRNEFAGKALVGMISSAVHADTFGDFHEGSAQVYAIKSYIAADAMLAERERTETLATQPPHAPVIYVVYQEMVD